jgi:exodeoxyribonuclease VII large subunit
MPVPTVQLSQLANLIQSTLQERFSNQIFWVVADVSDHKYYRDRDVHYFDLVEKDPSTGKLITRMSANAWSDGAQKISVFQQSTGQTFKSGIQIRCGVKVEFHIVYGLKLRLVDIDDAFTLGELERQKRETIERLLRECPDFISKKGEQLFTRNKSLILNTVLQRIAVVGSKQSAGYADFMHTLTQNRFGYRFVVDTYHTQVQGEANAAALVDQLIRVFRSQQPYDATIIIRGGGAETDFLLFNDFNLCRAVAKVPIPVITGIGHLKDQSITDLMAHTETNAPTKAAEFIIAHNRRFEEQLLHYQQQLIIRTQQRMAGTQKQLNLLESSLVNNCRNLLATHNRTLGLVQQQLSRSSLNLLYEHQHELLNIRHLLKSAPKQQFALEQQELNQLRQNIAVNQKNFIRNQQHSLTVYQTLVRLSSPEKILHRGFAIVRKANRIITDPAQLDPGDELNIQLKNSELSVHVNTIQHGS